MLNEEPNIERTGESLGILADSDSNNCFELSKFNERPKSAKRVEGISTQSINSFNQLLGGLPAVVTAKELSSGKYYIGVHKSTLLAAEGEGFRGMVRDASTGKFTNHARFYEPERLKNLVSFNVAFNMVSMVVAQKHLADISQKLDNIMEIVKNIERFQHDERTSRLDAAAETLREVCDSGCTESGIVLANSCSQKLKEVLQHLQKDIDRLLNSFEEKSKSEQSEHERRDSLSRFLKEHKACIELLAVSSFILATKESEIDLAQKRMAGLLEKVSKHEEYLERSHKIMSDHHPMLRKSLFYRLTGAFRSGGTRYLDRLQTITKSKLQKAELKNISLDESLQKGIKSALNNQLLLEIEDGMVSEIYQHDYVVQQI